MATASTKSILTDGIKFCHFEQIMLRNVDATFTQNKCTCEETTLKPFLVSFINRFFFVQNMPISINIDEQKLLTHLVFVVNMNVA